MVRVITVKPKDMSDETIKARLDGLKQEIKDNESEIKELEDELERRKQEDLLGVPLESFVHGNFWDNYSFCFASEESKFAFSIKLNDYVKALQGIAKGEPIDIQVLLPLLRKGWVAMEDNGLWVHYTKKPVRNNTGWKAESIMNYNVILMFNLKPADNWKDSLMECGL